MNSKMRDLAAVMSLALLQNADDRPRSERYISSPKKDISFLRKKCKSCKKFNISYCTIHQYKRDPLGTACKDYIPRKK